MTLLGLTGGIGSGKSHVARLLHRQWGIPVYDSDSRAKQLYAEDPALRQALVSLVGPQLFDADGQLCKPLLARYLFASDENARRINALVHPAVLRDMQAWADSQTASLLLLESALLVESGLADRVDHILFVDAPLETRIRRAMQRDHASREQIVARIARQQTREARRRADIVIRNAEGTTDEELLRQCHEALAPYIGQLNVNT